MTDINNTNETGKRRRRFRRDPEFRSKSAGTLIVGRRDLDIITAVARHRFLDTEQVCRLFGCDCPFVPKAATRAGRSVMLMRKQHRDNCSCTCGVAHSKAEHAETCAALFKDNQHVGSRLRELYQAGYLERPIAQLQLRVKAGVVEQGSVPMVYCVTSAGLALIGPERRARLGPGKLSWVNKVNEGGRVFIEHTLAVADVSIGVDLAVRRKSNLERLNDTALMAGMNEQRRTSVRPWGLKVRYKGEELTAVCDLAFAIGDTERRRRWNFLVEVDRGHMPVERSSLTQTSILRKLLTYAKAHHEGLHRTAFGWANFRVLILTTSEARARSCAKAARDRFGSAAVARIFLFGTLDAAKDLLAASYIDCKGQPEQLIENQSNRQRDGIAA